MLERDHQHRAIPTPRFARKFSTWNPPSLTEGIYPQNCMIELLRSQISSLHFDKFPDTGLSVLEYEFQNRAVLLFRLSYSRNVVDHRSRGGQISGRSYDVAVNWRVCIPEF